MMPSPRPSTSSLQTLNRAMSHHNNNNNNNNGGLHACVDAAEDIEPIRVTRAKYSAPLSLRWAKKDYGQPTSHIVFFLLCSVSLSTVCLYTVCKLYAHAPSLPLHFWWIQVPPIGWSMNYSVLSRFQWTRSDANILEMMQRTTEEKKIVLRRVDMIHSLEIHT